MTGVGPDDPRVHRFDREFIEATFMYLKQAACPHDRCAHTALAHCYHGDGYVHCTGGCPCASPARWRIEDNTDSAADGT